MYKKIVSFFSSLVKRSEKSFAKEDEDFIRRHAPLESAMGIKYLLDQVNALNLVDPTYVTLREVVIHSHHATVEELIQALTVKTRLIEQDSVLTSGARMDKSVILDDYLTGKSGEAVLLTDSVFRLTHWLLQYCNAMERVELERNSKLTYYMRLTILEVEDAITFLKVARSLSIR